MKLWCVWLFRLVWEVAVPQTAGLHSDPILGYAPSPAQSHLLPCLRVLLIKKIYDDVNEEFGTDEAAPN